MNVNDLPNLLTAKQYADYMQLSYRTIQKRLSDDSVKAFRVGSEWRFEKETGKGFDNLPEISDMPQLTSYLQTSRNTIMRAIETGKLKAFKAGRDWRFKKQDVISWVKK